MIDETYKGGSSLEPFLLLAKNARGAAAAQLIRQACDAPGVYVFGELIEIDSIKELESNPEFSKDWKLLQLYAYGKYSDYISNKSEIPDLTENQIKKLRLLTIASLASKSKYVPYAVLLENLGLSNLRQIEDLIIEAVYADILKGKLDQREERLEVDFVIGRDIQQQNIDTVISILDSWCSNCEKAMETLDTQSSRANYFKEVNLNKLKQVEQEVENVKQALKTQEMSLTQDIDIDSTMQQRSVHKLKGMKSSIKAASSRTR
ncbi:COP9 signalosome complex subunit 7a-like isoform X1 [Hydractinia symbiolongicarpus]|uniref:COP9 signalosome complex subunit 7a-like isoform X1 n=1 Tax=Hydractinia symbiolongicarpus TaxID=13093 RepID=UPI00254EB3F4|nr:COP9 signalosome complex subunit 7a-like isoform X1 [Hydractinia symbiolongicarpus]